jgi:hypothetical protein
VLVADDALAFADAIVRLHVDEPLWNRLVSGGLENVRRHFSADAARPVLEALIEAASAHRSGRATAHVTRRLKRVSIPRKIQREESTHARALGISCRFRRYRP